MSDSQRFPKTMDAVVWADEFVAGFPDMDRKLMITWFDSAIMAGYDSAVSRYVTLMREERAKAQEIYRQDTSDMWGAVESWRLDSQFKSGQLREELAGQELRITALRTYLSQTIAEKDTLYAELAKARAELVASANPGESVIE